MSFIAKKDTNFLFGNAGVKDGLDEQGYIGTLCLSCTVKRDKETKDTCVDLHVTREQLNSLRNAIDCALRNY